MNAPTVLLHLLHLLSLPTTFTTFKVGVQSKGVVKPVREQLLILKRVFGITHIIVATKSLLDVDFQMLVALAKTF